MSWVTWRARIAIDESFRCQNRDDKPGRLLRASGVN